MAQRKYFKRSRRLLLTTNEFISSEARRIRKKYHDAQFEAVAEEKKHRSNIEYDETGVHRKSTRYTVKIKINHEDGGE